MDDGPIVDLNDAERSAADDGTAVFAAERPRRLTGIAYRISGSLTDAEDVVQEAWLRFSKAMASPEHHRAAGGLADHGGGPDRPGPPEGGPTGAGGLRRAVAPGADRFRSVGGGPGRARRRWRSWPRP